MNRKDHLGHAANTVKPKQTPGSKHGSNSTVTTGVTNKQGNQNSSASSTPTPKSHQTAATIEQPNNNNWKIHSVTKRTPYNPHKDGTGTTQQKSPPKTSKASSGQSNHPQQQQHKQQPTNPPFYTTTNPANVKRTATKGHLKHGPITENSTKRSSGAATSAGKSNKPATLNVLLPPQTEKSVANSSIDSQLFVNNTSTAPHSGSSNFTTYKVELETTAATQDTFKAILQKQNGKDSNQDQHLNTIKEDAIGVINKDDFQIKTLALMSSKMIIPAVQNPSSNETLPSAIKQQLTQVVAKGEVEDENVDDILLTFPEIPSNPILIVSKEKLVLIPHRDETNKKGGTSAATAEEYNISEDDYNAVETKTEEAEDKDGESQQDLESTEVLAADPVEFWHSTIVTESSEQDKEKTLDKIEVVHDNSPDQTNTVIEELKVKHLQEVKVEVHAEEREENSKEKGNEKKMGNDSTALPIIIQNEAEPKGHGVTDDIPFQEDEKISAEILEKNGFKIESDEPSENIEEKAKESSHEDN